LTFEFRLVHVVTLLVAALSHISTEMGGYNVFIFDQAIQANSSWPSLCGKQNEYWWW